MPQSIKDIMIEKLNQAYTRHERVYAAGGINTYPELTPALVVSRTGSRLEDRERSLLPLLF
jgi:hypothetical protein